MKSCDEESIGRMLYMTAQTMTLHAEKVLKPYGLTVEQFVLLKNMSDTDALSQNQLCEIVQKSAANVTRILDRLEKKGCVIRTKNPEDRRSFLLLLTLQGSELVNEAISVVESFAEHLIHGISSQDQALFIQLLYKIQNNLARLPDNFSA